MTASSNPGTNPLSTPDSALRFGAAGYVAVLQGQLESTLKLTAAWATAVSAFSSSLLSQPVDRGEQGLSNPGFAGRNSVRPVGTASTPITDHVWPQNNWPDRSFEQRGSGRMLRWLTEPPTLQSDLFDEVVELLVDEDIKTAS